MMTQADRDAMDRQSGGEVRSAIDGVDNPYIHPNLMALYIRRRNWPLRL